MAQIMTDDSRTIYGGADGTDYFQDAQSMGELCLRRLTGFGQQVLLTDAATGQQLSGRGVRDRCIRQAECLRALGIRAGDTVALCTENRLEFAAVMVGTHILGACLTPINPSYTVREQVHAVQLSRPTVIFCETATAASFAAVAVECPFLQHLIVFDGVDGAAKAALPVGARLYSEFVDDPRVAPVLDATAYRCAPQDMADVVGLVLYSSGTTGLPKGVQLTQLNSLLSLHRHKQRPDNDVKAAVPVSTTLSIVPMFHTFGCHVLLASMLFGDHLVMLPRFEPTAFLRAIQTYRCTSLFVAPPLMVFLAKSPLVDQFDVSTVRSIFSGAAPLTAELQAAVFKRLNAPIIRQGYGMTEGTVAFTTQTDRCHTQGSVGELSCGLHGRVVEPESGRILGPNEEGELQFRGNAMRGYVGNALATAETIGADGWLRTGDIGYYTERGEWFVVDRLKELIKHKGFQVAPAELEGLLLQMPQVSDCGVIGVPDERAGELPMAFVVRQPGVQLSGAEVEEFVRQRASPSKWLSGGVQFVAQIPKNPSGKILRRELRAAAKNMASPLVSKL